MKKLFTLFFIFTSALIQAQVFDDANAIKPLKTGESIPNVTLQSLESKSILLPEIISAQKTVLVFFRGGWCTYCNKHLAALGELENQIKELGYQVIAISPDSVEKLQENMDKNELNYKLYSDSSTTLIQAMGIAIKAPDRYTNMLLKYSENENSNVIPVPGVFIIDTNGEILYTYTNPNYKERLEEKELLTALKENR